MTVTVLHGDCRSVLPTLAAESVNCVVTSPRRKSNGQFVKSVHAYRDPKPHWSADWLRREYIDKGRSSGDIASEIGITDAAILFWLRKHGIPRRSVSAARAVKHWGANGADNPMHGRTGSQNPRFIDGSSPERQRLYVHGSGRAFLRAIVARDGYACVRCGAAKAGKRSLHVHHIRPWAGNPTLRFSEKNVVTLCRACHGFIHSKKNVGGEYLA